MSGRASRRSSTARRAGKGRWPAGAKSDGRFGKQDFAYLPKEDVYRCPAGERLPYRNTNEEAGKVLRRYWTTACPKCSLKSQCTTGPEPRITRWEHEHLLEAVPQRLDANPRAMRIARRSSIHSLGGHLHPLRSSQIWEGDQAHDEPIHLTRCNSSPPQMKSAHPSMRIVFRSISMRLPLNVWPRSAS